LRSHCSRTATTYSRSVAVSSQPRAIPCHFCRQPLQQQAVACCATKTGCPRNGVCFPSFASQAGANRAATKPRACSSTVESPQSRRYARSRSSSLNRRRKGERASAANTSSRDLISILTVSFRNTSHRSHEKQPSDFRLSSRLKFSLTCKFWSASRPSLPPRLKSGATFRLSRDV
jgi:hypothetical protein